MTDGQGLALLRTQDQQGRDIMLNTHEGTENAATVHRVDKISESWFESEQDRQPSSSEHSMTFAPTSLKKSSIYDWSVGKRPLARRTRLHETKRDKCLHSFQVKSQRTGNGFEFSISEGSTP